jgi:hypothetical protein
LIGWKAPRNSTELVYPSGRNKSASDDELNISFRPTPNYAALAGSEDSAAPEKDAWMLGVRVKNVGEMKAALEKAKERVGKVRKGMLIEVLI